MKKTIALLLAVIMVFSMVACAAKETPVAPEKEETPAAPEKEETSVEGTEAPAEEDPIVVGMIMQDVIGQMGSDMRAQPTTWQINLEPKLSLWMDSPSWRHRLTALIVCSLAANWIQLLSGRVMTRVFLSRLRPVMTPAFRSSPLT